MHDTVYKLVNQLVKPSLGVCCEGVRIEYAVKSMNEGLSYEQYLHELAQIECDVRRANKIVRLVKASRLPMEKTLENFNLKRLPLRIRQQVKLLQDGSFVDRCENLLAFDHSRCDRPACAPQRCPGIERSEPFENTLGRVPLFRWGLLIGL